MVNLPPPSALPDADGPVPADNLPGHHPEHEQDKPVERFVHRARELAAEAPESPSPLAQRVSGVATAPLRLTGHVLERLRDRL